VSLPIAQAQTFDVYTREQLALSVGDTVRITKNFQSGGAKFRNNELATVKEIQGDKLIVADGRWIKNIHPIHLDQGVAVTSHASQGKTFDQVIVSAPVSTFSQVNQAMCYVAMSRARHAMHMFTDSIASLRQAVVRPSERVSATSLLSRAITMGLDHARRAAMQTQQRAMHMAHGRER
jgi:ATP-dependent exoDNAse (exonuclease V) alpha subunit